MNLDDKVHLLKRAQIAYPKTNKVSSEVFSRYADFCGCFFIKIGYKAF